MGNVIGSLFSGLAAGVNQLLGSPLDFLAGKNCSSLCSATWDLFCYIDNFCIAHLVKLATLSVLVYFVLLFFYLVFQLGICQCICHTIFRVMWACCATSFSIIEYCCACLCYNLPRLRRTTRRHKRVIKDFSPSSSDEEYYDEEEIIGSKRRSSRHLHRKMGEKRASIRHRRDYKRERLRKSLGAKSHRVQVGMRGNLVHLKKRSSMGFGHKESSLAHGIKVTRTTKFAHKGGNSKGFAKKRKM